MTPKILDFIVFLINNISNELNESVSEIYSKLESINAFDNYLIPCYEVLHTQGKEYLIEDLKEYAELRGVTL